MDGEFEQPTRHTSDEVEESIVRLAHKRKKVRNKRRRAVLFILLFVLLIGGGAGGWLYLHRAISPIPKKIQKSVSFPVYYPDPKKLPAGYTLDKNSINTPQKNAVLYKVNFDQDKKWVFSLQQKPSDDEIQSFYANYIPLRNKLDIPLGHVEIGAYNNKGTVESVVSLPISRSNTWIIVTGPANFDQPKLEQVLKSLRL